MAGRPSPVDRLAEKFEITDTGCWEWTAGKFPNGYGQFWLNGTPVGAHRAMWEEVVGIIPPDLEIDHLCKVKHCVNPDHLEPVTRDENNARSNSISAVNARKTHCKHGHPLDGDNLYVWRGRPTRRGCKTCLGIRS